jgi:predicted DNA-binding helix-hairpin-helix protein
VLFLPSYPPSSNAMPLCNFLPIILSPSLKVEREDEEWAALQAPRCAQALATMRSFLPPDLATRTKADLVEVCGLPPPLARRLLEMRQLRLIVTHPEDTAKLHYVSTMQY